MTQPYDYWHVQGGSGLTLLFQGREWATPAAANGTYAWNMLTARPFFVGDSGLKVSRVGLYLFSNAYASSATCRIGIYSCPPPSEHNMFPANLVTDLGELSLNGGGLTKYVYKAAASPIELGPGYWYIATRFTPGTEIVIGTVHAENTLGGPGYPLGYSPANGVGLIGFSAYDPPGPLPATFPAISDRPFGVVQYSTNPPTAIYMEADTFTTGIVQVRFDYLSGSAGATVTTDTPTSIVVRHGTNTPVATVVAALDGATNIRSGRVFNVGITTVMPNFGSSTEQLTEGGPLQNGGTKVRNYFPATAIEVVS